MRAGIGAASASASRAHALRRRQSFLMDHGLTGPPGLIGGAPGATNEIRVSQGGDALCPEHRSKGEGYVLLPGDWVQVRTPGGGGGYGDPADRDPNSARGTCGAVTTGRLQSFGAPSSPLPLRGVSPLSELLHGRRVTRPSCRTPPAYSLGCRSKPRTRRSRQAVTRPI